MIYLFLKKFIVKIFSSNVRVLSKRFFVVWQGRGLFFSANTFVKKQSPPLRILAPPPPPQNAFSSRLNERGPKRGTTTCEFPFWGASQRIPLFLSLYSLRESGLIYECKLGPGNGIFRRDGLSFSIFHDLKQVAKCGTLLVSSWLLFPPPADNEATNPRLMAACPQLYFFLRLLLLRLLNERGRKKRTSNGDLLTRAPNILSSSSRGRLRGSDKGFPKANGRIMF